MFINLKEYVCFITEVESGNLVCICMTNLLSKIKSFINTYYFWQMSSAVIIFKRIYYTEMILS